jgi:hypothetical protein
MATQRVPAIMPMATHDIAVDAWQRSVRAGNRAEIAIDEILEIKTGMLHLSGEIASFATEAQRDRIAAQDERREMRRQMNALTRAMREVREAVVPPTPPGQMREPLETLPEIIVELNRTIIAQAEAQAEKAATRHSDAKKLRRYNWLEKAIEAGAFEMVKRVAGLVLIGAVGWAAHVFLGTTPHEKRAEPTPIVREAH